MSVTTTNEIAVVGGSAAGALTSMLLARAGHDVVMIDHDELEPAATVEAAASSAHRPTAPQIVQPHMVMARCRQLLKTSLPDVYDALLAAGVVEAPIATQMPSTLADRTERPGDERLSMLVTRRSTFDWVLQRSVRGEPGVEVRGGVRVEGLIARSGTPPRVVGVHTNGGDVVADVVVDAMGRRTPIDSWLEDIHARPPAKWWAECGLAYFSRQYRVRPGVELPGSPLMRTVLGLADHTVGMWPGDNGTVQLAVVPLATDRRFRGLRDPDSFTSAVRSVPEFACWIEALEPITPVFPMAGLHNTLRRLVADGAPVVAGLHAVGDAVCTTNPTLSRGLSLAMTNAVDVVDTLATHGDDPIGHTQAIDRMVGEHVTPHYEEQACIDAARLAELRHTIDGTPLPVPAPLGDDRVDYVALRAAARHDPVAFRAFWEVQGMLRLPNDVYTDPDVVRAVHRSACHA